MNPSWIDERIGTGSKAAFLYGAAADPFGEAQIMWQTEFWNRSVGTVYTLARLIQVSPQVRRWTQ